MTNKYHSFIEHGRLHICNKTDSVSWKLYAKNAVRVIKSNADGNHGASICLSESYHSDSSQNLVSKETYIHLEAEQLDQFIAHLQAIRADITPKAAE